MVTIFVSWNVSQNIGHNKMTRTHAHTHTRTRTHTHTHTHTYASTIRCATVSSTGNSHLRCMTSIRCPAPSSTGMLNSHSGLVMFRPEELVRVPDSTNRGTVDTQLSFMYVVSTVRLIDFGVWYKLLDWLQLYEYGTTVWQWQQERWEQVPFLDDKMERIFVSSVPHAHAGRVVWVQSLYFFLNFFCVHGRDLRQQHNTARL